MKTANEMMTAEEASRKWGISVRSVQIHCQKGNVRGATLLGKSWRIPSNLEKPERKPRAKGAPQSILSALKAEKRAQIKGGLYHWLQVAFAFNSNHMEGSRLTQDQTRWIYETKTIGELPSEVPVDDIVEAANHFRAVDFVIESAGARLSERYIKTLHNLLKSGTTDARREWFTVGSYKKLDNVVGEMETCPASEVPARMAELVREYAAGGKTLDAILEFHVRFERIHPFQDGNGRVGRLILLKECLKYGHTPFVIAENLRQFYYKGLSEWSGGSHLRLRETCGTGQDVFKSVLESVGYKNLVLPQEL